MGNKNAGAFRAKKRLGQNFLKSGTLIEEIIDGSGIGPEDLVIEIGPGMGALTEAAAKKAGKVIAVEIDSDLIPVLETKFALTENVKIVEGDILETDIAGMIEEELAQSADAAGSRTLTGARIIGNLPYYITTPIIMKLLEEDIPAKSITIMMQKEVAERIEAAPDGKDYGALTIAVGYHCTVSEIADAPAECFHPRPKVESRVLQLTLREEKAASPIDEKMFFDCVRAGFSQRRKTLANCLAPLAGGNKAEASRLLEQAGVDPSRRAETLSMEEFAKVSDSFAVRS